MKKNWKLFLIIGIIILLLGASAIISSLAGKVPSNDISVTGNTAGNLNNGGLYAESNGKVYFSNAYDNGCLYSMNSDETEFEKLSTNQVNSINVGGNFLYYYMDSSGGGTGLGYVVRTYGVYRSKLNGNDTKCLDRNAAVTMQLVGDYVYYQRYNNKDFTNHYLYSLDTRTDSISTVFEGNLWYPAYNAGYIYYMDVSSNYRLCRYSLYENTVEILTNDRVDTFNVGDSYIYYQRNSATDPALMRMRLDGSEPEVVASGNYTNINLTSTYAYFNAFGSDVPVYHTPVNGPVNVTTFTAAMDAVEK